jgi:hypothetical protein
MTQLAEESRKRRFGVPCRRIRDDLAPFPQLALERAARWIHLDPVDGRRALVGSSFARHVAKNA